MSGHCEECCNDTWVTVGQGTWSQCAMCGEMRRTDSLRRRSKWWRREPTRPYSAVVAMLMSQRHRFQADIDVLVEANAEQGAGLERLFNALSSVEDAYQTFVDAHGPLIDYSTSAEMVDFEHALAAGAASVARTEPE